ncbi:GNAT family N-acetyltransferase [Candidatus Thorarchaeota archaeon]|nr:MAG: GNAT family N-acetyltransferase [Candidatus Thorarchaeota archaeon]
MWETRVDCMQVVRATPDDMEMIVHVVNADVMYKDIIPAEHYKEPFLTSDELKRYLQEMNLTFFLCREGASVTGVGALIVREDGDGQLGWIFVLPERQRRGVGTALVAEIESRARERGISRMILETDGGAYWAKSFYAKLGYREYRRTDLPWGHKVWMEKDLSSP